MSTQKGCWQKLCECFQRKRNRRQENPIENGLPDTVLQIQIRRNAHNRIYYDALDLKSDWLVNKFKILSKIKKNEIKRFTAKTPDKKITFNCPICFYYFDHILKFSCCNNVICIYCVEDFLSSQVLHQMELKCPFCRLQDKTIVLIDVEPEEKLRSYCDSPMLTNTAGSFERNKKEADLLTLKGV